LTARDILLTYSQKELENIFYTYGEEPKTRFIVDAIIKARKEKPLETTAELASLIEAASFDPKSKLRVFQALRMEVNNEL
jgi:16S rRNA (cytosine1402-N4)-methyltransferase